MRTHLVVEGEPRDSMEWLKVNSEPWSEVLLHWKSTFCIRIASNKKTVSEFIKEWPILKINRAQDLVSSILTEGIYFFLY